MRKLLMTMAILLILAEPVRALDLEVPVVPETGKAFMPSEPENFTQGLLEVIRDAVMHLSPHLKEGTAACVGVTAALMVVSILKSLPGAPEKAADLAGTAFISVILLGAANSLVNLAAETVIQISEYGKLLLPVMTASMAAQGSVTGSAALYAATAVFDALLVSLIGKLLSPMIYLYLAVSVGASAVGEESIRKLRDKIKGFISWILKTLLYIYTGFISITGAVSGAKDAAALKAAKLTISGVVPVVGGILSDASEAVLVAASAVKNGAGIYGMFAVLALWLGPFLKIGAQYMLLKATGTVCSIFGSKPHCTLIEDFSSAMGLLLAMTGSVCLLLMISLLCYMRGVG